MNSAIPLKKRVGTDAIRAERSEQEVAAHQNNS